MAKIPNFDIEMQSHNQFLKEFKDRNIALYLKREDLLHPEVSGNKFRKIKYNLQAAVEEKKRRLLTFGGAFSNHIAATAAAGKLAGIKTIGIIRGDELAANRKSTLSNNPTLKFAHSCGMQLHFVSRTVYRQKENPGFIENLRLEFGDFYLLPEGGTNDLAIKGCEEILTEEDKSFDVVACAVGTGGTIAGIINSSAENQKVLGFPALKGDFLSGEIGNKTSRNTWELILNYHFGGYAKVTEELINFINSFKGQFNIQLDPIYTGKLLFGIFDLIETGYFPENSRILAIHTGGVQGIAGMNQKLIRKNLPLIHI